MLQTPPAKAVILDADPRSAYFRQARNGLWVRMAVLDWAMAR